MSLQEIQYNYLDSAKEMFACGLFFLCVAVGVSRFEGLYLDTGWVCSTNNVHSCGQTGGRGPIGGTPGDFMGSLENWRKHEGKKY